MKSFIASSLLFAHLASAEHIHAKVAVIDIELDEEEDILLEAHVITPEDVLLHKNPKDVIYLPEPTAKTVKEADKLPGKWTDEQELSLETFKEIVAADVENVWVVAYIDPRCRDCYVLSVEWEKLTQIEEKEKRKIKLGYVDISVEENWKIIQDHTKGKRLNQTPQVTLYGENKKTPHFYKKDHPDAKGVHTWVSDYADTYGYGYWTPDAYNGANVRKGYKYDDKHDHRYRTAGKYIKGDQVTQLSKDSKGVVMRRRTVAQGGKLTGIAHQQPKYGYGTRPRVRPSYNGQRGHGGYSAYGKSDSSHQGSYNVDRRSNGYGQKYGQSNKYGNSYGGHSGHGRHNQASRYGNQNRYGKQQGQHGNYQDSGVYGSKKSSGYGVSGQYGGRQQGKGYGAYGQKKLRSRGDRIVNQHRPAKQVKNAGNYQGSYGGSKGYYNADHALDSVYGRSKVDYTNQGQAKKNGARLGSYGNPYTKYYGPGYKNLNQSYDGYGSVRWHQKYGKGIVLGKYTNTNGQTYELMDYDEKAIIDKDSKAYQQALDLVKRSGHGQSTINFGGSDYQISDVIVTEDIPDVSHVKQSISIPSVERALAESRAQKEAERQAAKHKQ